ncbi:ABC-three component system protein [Cellulomonas hominis]|uniref:ABC-three component system protein n=1 Tax=Cellulomonas hominis TaxID=156981 RepID=UPI001BCEE28F|nr:ABC-three component system protein [Cellulomonas hominis]
MFINSLSSSDRRFKTLRFRDGLNILVADRTESSEQGDSRNSIGKTSSVKVLRYLLGGDLPKELKVPELAEHKFTAVLELPAAGGVGVDTVTVTRAVSPQTRVDVDGWSVVTDRQSLHVDDWKALQAKHLFEIPEGVNRPTPGQLWGQAIRNLFAHPTKVHATEPDWESGVRIGHLLGLSSEILAKSGEVEQLAKQGKAIRKAVKEGALPHLALDEAKLRARLASARHRRDAAQNSISSYRVDEQYADHQRRADELTASIQKLNDEGIALQRRLRELREALRDEVDPADEAELRMKLARVYTELGVVLPDLVTRRYEEVADFHRSVVRNRRVFLQQELDAVEARLVEIDSERSALDSERSEVLRLLAETVALDTFLAVQRDLAGLEADVADLERRVEAAARVSQIGDQVKLKTAELVTSVRAELRERSESLDAPIALFGELGAEIYTDREASLLIEPTDKGILKVTPYLSGDASMGVKNVETFIFDMVCLVSAIKNDRAPRILVHDSHLFDSIDGRQIASCLNIGARLAEQHGFQYVVTLNSDFIDLVEAQSDGAFDAEPYIMSTRLTDETDEGGLFGFRFN